MMLSMWLILAGVCLVSLSGIPALFMSRKSCAGQRVTVSIFITGSLLGIFGAVLCASQANSPFLQIDWALPWGMFFVSVDHLSVFFLLLVFSVPALGSLYSLGYWKQSEHEHNGQRLGVFFGLLAGAMAMVVIARDAVLFLIVWEIMALSAYFAAGAEDDKQEVQRAGWVYLVATHVGTLIIMSMFVLWKNATGSFNLNASYTVPSETAGVIFILAVVGFGFKAGIMPLHVWLPGAHANAPSHVSAVMSGVMLKMGIYGIVRMTGLLPVQDMWWGAAMLIAGALSGIAAIAFALGQRDIKRMLAYSSIENIGIIFLGIGLALLGRYAGRQDWIALGLGGALLHVWNHGLFKSLLFLNSGAIIHSCGTRDMENLGGLMKAMPLTGLLFIIGAVSISGLPPMNGFASEFLVYLGFFNTISSGSGPMIMLAGISAAALAMIGALAVAAFVRLFSTMFLGVPRSRDTEHAHDPVFSMIIPMAVLGLLCVSIGLYPAFTSPFIERAAAAWYPFADNRATIANLAPQIWISALGFAVVALSLVIFLYIRYIKPCSVKKGVTWDCGYAMPTGSMQYTGTSFAQILVKLFAFILRPGREEQKIDRYFPEKSTYGESVPDALLDKMILPLFNISGRHLPKVRVFQQGQTHVYVLYILAVVIMLFIFSGVGISL